MYHDCHLRNVLFSAIMHGVMPLPCLRVQERKRHSALAPRSPGTRPWRRPGGTWAAEHTAWATAGPAKRLHPALADSYSATECSSGACAPGPRSATACSLNSCADQNACAGSRFAQSARHVHTSAATTTATAAAAPRASVHPCQAAGRCHVPHQQLPRCSFSTGRKEERKLCGSGHVRLL